MSPAVYDPEWVPATFRGHYRHMAKRDGEVWERFLAIHAARFDAFAYDVALGGVIFGGMPMEDHEQKGWQYSTALKIDAIGREGDRYWIIEVRPEATVSALGAALTYAMVCQRDAVVPGELLPTVVCQYMQPDVQWACDTLGIQVFTVPSG
jgi:hypothetical protein